MGVQIRQIFSLKGLMLCPLLFTAASFLLIFGALEAVIIAEWAQ
jgi:hypothetical protein